MEISEYMDKMFQKYENWINNPKDFTPEVAAFEYLKRNPYFIEVTYFFNKQIEEVRDNRDAKQELTFLLEQMRLTFRRLFLYSGIDIVNLHNVYTGGNTAFHTESHSLAYTLKTSEFPKKDQHYNYSDIYFTYTSKAPGDSGEMYKREHVIDLDMMLGDKHRERWLEHLKPSLYLKINPYHSQEQLKSDLAKVLHLIREDYPEYATSEFMINEHGKYEGSFRTPTIQPINSICALILYDLKNIFHISNPQKIQDLLIQRFKRETYNNNFNKFFRSSKRSNGHQLIFKTVHKTNIEEVQERINGKYLNYIYSESVVDAHIEMIRNEYYSYEGEDSFDTFIKQLKLEDNIKDRLEHLLLDIKSYSQEEYEALSKKLFNYQLISGNEIFKILLM